MAHLSPTDSARINERHWDERVDAHVRSAFYDVPGFLAGECKLKPEDVAELGDVKGQRLLHLQCHFGLDTLSWARRGAEVVGLDLSESAVRAARDLATRAGLAAEFVQADVHAADRALGVGHTREPFDVVVTGVGALCWLPKIRPWAAVVARCVKPGGVLYVREGHPMMWAMADRLGPDGHAVVCPYFEASEPVVCVEPGSYADPSAVFETNESHTWNHGLGEIVSALVAEGFTLEFLHEHERCDWKAFPHMVQCEAAMWRLPESSPRFPLMYSLKARRW